MSHKSEFELPSSVHKRLFLLRRDDISLVQATTTGKYVFELQMFRPNGDIIIVEIWNEDRGTAAYRYFTNLARESNTKVYFAEATGAMARQKIPHFITAELSDYQKSSTLPKYQKVTGRIIVTNSNKPGELSFSQFTRCAPKPGQVETIDGELVRDVAEWAYTKEERVELSVPPPNLYEQMFSASTAYNGVASASASAAAKPNGKAATPAEVPKAHKTEVHAKSKIREPKETSKSDAAAEKPVPSASPAASGTSADIAQNPTTAGEETAGTARLASTMETDDKTANKRPKK